MFQHNFSKVLTLSGDGRTEPLTLAQLRKRKGREELSDKVKEQLREEEQENARITGADEFASIKRHLPLLLESNKHDIASTALESYLNSFPRSTEAYFLLASVYEHAGAYDRALEAVRIAIYLEPESQKISGKVQAIENKALGQQRASLEMKVKCYSVSRLFEEWGAADSHVALDVAVSAELQRQIAADLSLLSPLSIGVSLESVSQYYENIETQYQTSYTDGVNSAKPFRLQDTFPFQCTATRKLRTGSLVMADVPFAIAPLLDGDNPKLFPTCFHCLKERPVLDQGFACPLFPKSCPFIFCSAECVLRNVNIHRQECGFITSVVFPLAKETGFSPGFVLLVLRALCRAYLERSLRKPEAEELQFFFRLHSFISDYKTQRPWIWNCIVSLSRGLCLFLPLEFRLFMGEIELREFIATIHSNVIPISYDSPAASIQRSASTASIGLALCHNTCSIGHSCIPTCSYVYTPDGRVVVRTILDVPQEGALTASFVEDLFLPTAIRKNIESSWKVISCSCKRCREVHEGNRHVRGQRCSDCIRGIRNPLHHPIIRGILDEQMKNHPRMKPAVGDTDKENREGRESDSFGWYCSLCGTLSPLDSNRCEALEVQLQAKLDEARAAWGVGETLKSRKLLEEINKQYSIQLHANHYILYTVNVFLSGLWSHGAGKDLNKALFYLRKAILAASAVLPFYHAEKAHLFSTYADITFALSVARKTQRRGLWNNEVVGEDVEQFILFSIGSDLLPIEAQWIAVVNSWICCGPKSAQWIANLQRLRHLVGTVGQHTPPLLYVPKVTNVERVANAVRRLLRNPGLTTKEIMDMVTKDHLYLITAACASGDVTTLQDITRAEASTKREVETADLLTGWTSLGQAAVSGQIEVVRHLLGAANANLFAENEWKITPLLAMASRPIDLDEGGDLKKKEDRDAATVCRLFVEKAKDMEKERFQQIHLMNLPIRQDIKVDEFPFLRRRLLDARSHPLIGSNSAAHYAAIRCKPLLISQIIRSGLDVNVRNTERATPLHLASIAGHATVVEELIRLSANANALNYRGETPLMLACYGLHEAVVSTLLHRGGADVSLSASQSCMHCLHALALGLTRTHRSRYMGSNKLKDDALSVCLGGFNPKAKEFTEDAWGQPPVTYLSMPVFEPEGSSLFLFPDELLRRLGLAERIGETLLKVCPASMYALRARVGYSAAELLRHRADYLLEEHQQAWGRSDLRLVVLSQEKRMQVRQEWREVFNRIDTLTQLLTPEKLVKGPIPKQSKEMEKDQKASLQAQKVKESLSKASLKMKPKVQALKQPPLEVSTMKPGQIQTSKSPKIVPIALQKALPSSMVETKKLPLMKKVPGPKLPPPPKKPKLPT